MGGGDHDAPTLRPMDADPVWPVVLLALFQVGDAVVCAIPTPFITAALDRVDCPAPLRRVLPMVKAASAVGLVVGLWITIVGLLTVVALVGYFAVAIAFHVRARDTLISSAGAPLMLVGVVMVGASFL